MYENSDSFYSVITFLYTKCFVHSYTVDVVFTLSYWSFVRESTDDAKIKHIQTFFIPNLANIL